MNLDPVTVCVPDMEVQRGGGSPGVRYEISR